ncbi:MAG: molybdopterin-synthase adenylyltransferase MoeB [Thermoplasmata archaeon]
MMATGTVRVEIPTPLRGWVDGQAAIEVEGSTVGTVLEAVAARYPALRPHLFGPTGALRGFVSIYLNQEDIRYREREATPVRRGDVISIVPAIAGGAGEPATVGLSREEMQRYSRHLLLPEVGLRGQRKLKEARVLLVGAGGLGSPTATYLAAAGVGRIGLVEFDTVDLSNLQRQILYTTEDLGRPKLEVAAERLRALNPEVTVEPHPGPLTSANALDLLKCYDVVVDGTDNFPTRYLVNDAAVLTGIPNVYGSIYRFEGQVTVFGGRAGPCYRCLYPEPPPPNLVPSCAEAGVLGVLPGVVGLLQAIETLKLLLGVGEPLIGRLLLFDALALRFRELQVRASPDCDLCGPKATQRGLIDYPEFCGVSAPGAPNASEIPSILPAELVGRLRDHDPPLLLDVREPEEWAIARIEGARLIPLGELAERVDELTGAREIVVYCKMGGRSARAVAQLTELGFRGVRHLDGGIDRWSRDVDPSMPRY